jgi:hypothetical protein
MSTLNKDYAGKTLLQALRIFVQNEPRIARVFFYVWPGWNTDLDRFAIHTDGQSIIMPKNQNEYVVSVTREKLLNYEPVLKLIEIIERRDLISLCTRVEMSDGRELYIPTIDVKLKKAKRHLLYLETFAQYIYDRLHYNGDLLIFESTNSYYLMGTELMHLHDMLEFLAFCTLTKVELSPSIITSLNDTEYLGYTLLKRFDNGLRLTNNMEESSSITPKVAKVVHHQATNLPQPLPVTELTDELLKKLGRR